MSETRGRPITDHSPGGQARRDQYATLRGAYLCAWSVSCGRNAAFGSPCCDRHREAIRQATQRVRDRQRVEGRCACGAEVTGRSRCWLCSERRKGYASRQPEYRKMKERTKR